jgi:hypothetical protein
MVVKNKLMNKKTQPAGDKATPRHCCDRDTFLLRKPLNPTPTLICYEQRPHISSHDLQELSRTNLTHMLLELEGEECTDMQWSFQKCGKLGISDSR